LHAHVVENFRELVSLVPRQAAPIVQKLLEQRFLWNLKMLVVAIHHQIPKEDRIRELLPSPLHTLENLELLASAESMDQLLEFLKDTDYSKAITGALPDYERFGPSPVLVALDKTYYSSLWDIARKSKTDRKVVRELIGYLVDATNVKTILRLREARMPASEIDRYLIRPAHELSESMMKAMITAEDHKSAIHAIRITLVGGVLHRAVEEVIAEGVEMAEHLLDEYYVQMCRRMEFLHQFSIAPVLSYIAQKEVEFRKLRKCLRLKADGLPSDEIKRRLEVRVR